MLHTKFKVIGFFMSREEDFFKVFTIHVWRPSWSCDLDRLNKLLFPKSKEAPNGIMLQLAQWFQGRRCLKMLPYIHTDDRGLPICISSCMSLKAQAKKSFQNGRISPYNHYISVTSFAFLFCISNLSHAQCDILLML